MHLCELPLFPPPPELPSPSPPQYAWQVRQLALLMLDPRNLYIPQPPQILGSGAFGMVILGVYNGVEVAIKRIQPPKLPGQGMRRGKSRNLVRASSAYMNGNITPPSEAPTQPPEPPAQPVASGIGSGGSVPGAQNRGRRRSLTMDRVQLSRLEGSILSGVMGGVSDKPPALVLPPSVPAASSPSQSRHEQLSRASSMNRGGSGIGPASGVDPSPTGTGTTTPSPRGTGAGEGPLAVRPSEGSFGSLIVPASSNRFSSVHDTGGQQFRWAGAAFGGHSSPPPLLLTPMHHSLQAQVGRAGPQGDAGDGAPCPAYPDGDRDHRRRGQWQRPDLCNRRATPAAGPQVDPRGSLPRPHGGAVGGQRAGHRLLPPISRSQLQPATQQD